MPPNWLSRWVHRHCLVRETALIHERDHLDSQRSQADRAHKSILIAYQRSHAREESLLRDRDRLDTEHLRLKKMYDDLMIAYRQLVESTMTRLQPPDLWQHLFEEAPITDDQKRYLTPGPEPEEAP